MTRMIAVFNVPYATHHSDVEAALEDIYEDAEATVWDSMEDFMLDKRDGYVRGFDD